MKNPDEEGGGGGGGAGGVLSTFYVLMFGKIIVKGVPDFHFLQLILCGLYIFSIFTFSGLPKKEGKKSPQSKTLLCLKTPLLETNLENP